MDFLEIRKKARERGATRDGAKPPAPGPARPDGDVSAEPGPSPIEAAPAVSTAAPPPPAPAAVPPAPSAPAPSPVPDRGFPVVISAAPARADEAPPPSAEAAQHAASDASLFTTWRPGSGARPVIPAPEPVRVQPAVTDFAVYAPRDHRPAAPDPAPAPAPPSAAPAVAARRPHAPVTLSPLSPLSPLAPEPPHDRRPPPPPSPPPGDPLDDFFFRPDEAAPALPALGPAALAAPPPEAREESAVDEYLTFLLGAEEYAVAITRVREVLKAPPITEVPRAPAFILGVVTVRGDVVPVFDPRLRLGLPASPDVELTGRIVIVDDGEGPCGLLVDRLSSVVRLPRGSIEPCPQGIAGAAADCLAGIGRERGRLFTVLELAGLLRKAPARRGEGRGHAGA